MTQKHENGNSISQVPALHFSPAFSSENPAEAYFLPGTSRHGLISSVHDGREEYCIDLYVPSGDAPAGGWPVIIALDAGGCFATCVEALGRLARRSDATGVCQAIVAGISSPVEGGDGGYDSARRHRDFTSARSDMPSATDANATDTNSAPVSPAPPSASSAERVRPSGGAEAFLDFIEQDVLAFISAHYPVDARWRTVFGHSLGGYFTLWAMTQRPDLFNCYAAISPSLWWDWDALVSGLNAAPLVGQRVMIAVGEWEEALPPWQVGLPGSAEILARRKKRRMVGRARDMAELVSARLGPDHVQFYEMPQEDHASIVSGAVPRMLRIASLR